MDQLTRRRDPNARLENWLILYDNLQVGSIGLRSGVPTYVHQWGWRVGLPQVIVPRSADDWDGCHLRAGARGLRDGVASLSATLHRRRLRGVSQTAGMDPLEVYDA